MRLGATNRYLQRYDLIILSIGTYTRFLLSFSNGISWQPSKYALKEQAHIREVKVHSVLLSR